MRHLALFATTSVISEAGIQPCGQVWLQLCQERICSNILPRGEHHYGQWMKQPPSVLCHRGSQASYHGQCPRGMSTLTFCAAPILILLATSRHGTEYESFAETRLSIPLSFHHRLQGGPHDHKHRILEGDMNKIDPASIITSIPLLARQLALTSQCTVCCRWLPISLTTMRNIQMPSSL